MVSCLGMSLSHVSFRGKQINLNGNCIICWNTDRSKYGNFQFGILRCPAWFLFSASKIFCAKMSENDEELEQSNHIYKNIKTKKCGT